MNASTINVNFHHQIIYKHSDNCSTTLLHGIIATCTQIQGVRRNDAHSRIRQAVPQNVGFHHWRYIDRMVLHTGTTSCRAPIQQPYLSQRNRKQRTKSRTLTLSHWWGTTDIVGLHGQLSLLSEQTAENSIEHGTTAENTQDSYQIIIAISSTIASTLPTAMLRSTTNDSRDTRQRSLCLNHSANISSKAAWFKEQRHHKRCQQEKRFGFYRARLDRRQQSFFIHTSVWARLDWPNLN